MAAVAENSLSSDPAGGGIAPVATPWVTRRTSWVPTSRRTWASASSWRAWASPARPRARTVAVKTSSSPLASGPDERPLVWGEPPPTALRSWNSSRLATVQPSSTSPMTSAAAMATSVKNSWQNSIEPST